jgi:hypothetical protein
VDKRAPISVKFEIPYFTVSGIQVRYLKVVEKAGYSSLPWVRYITQNGDDYTLRTVSMFHWSRPATLLTNDPGPSQIADTKQSSIIAPL